MPTEISWTAKIVAMARAVGVSCDLRDPLARRVASPGRWASIDGLAKNGILPAVVRQSLRVVSMGLIDHNTIRMLAIDRMIERAMSEGIEQLVLLGAGFDSRAWRLKCLRSCSVYELDRREIQGVKRASVASMMPTARALALLPIDLQAESLRRTLQLSDFNEGRPTQWIMEGVSAYLFPRDFGNVMSQVSLLSAPKSQFIASYVPPASASLGKSMLGGSEQLLAIMGERITGLISEPEVAQLVVASGLTIGRDFSWPQWAESVQGYRPVPNMFRERIILAEQRA